MIGIREFFLPVFVSIAGLGFAGSSTPPVLDHSAPFLGHPLDLEVSGATPGFSAQLLQSPAAGELVLPYGVLELDPDQVSVVGNTVVGPDGTASFRLRIPRARAFAELECHYQVLIGDAAQPATAALSEAVHLRLLGSRAYVGYQGATSPGGLGGVSIVSVVREEVVETIELGPISAPPVSEERRRNAAMPKRSSMRTTPGGR